MHYVDTSALLKRFVPERNSDAFDEWFANHAPVVITRLGVLEMRCALARRRRAGQIPLDREQAAVKEVQTDILDGALVVRANHDEHLVDAYHLIEQLPAVALRTLDALHLAAARQFGLTAIATADHVMRAAAIALGLEVVFFGPEEP
ncbi:MAG: type II toxin-antitoxin system VapC family toxin [Pseudomonadota bacterium]|jgi:predicted nucleic acid-binding protein